MKSDHQDEFSYEPIDDQPGAYLMKMVSFEGPVTRILLLEGVEDLSDNLLPEDGATVLAITKFMLLHQDAAQLPPVLEIADIFAAYDDPFEELAKLRKNFL